MRYMVSVNGRKHTVELEENGHIRRLILDERTVTIDWRLISRDQSDPYPSDSRADLYSLLVGDRSYAAYARLLQETGSDEMPGRKIEVLFHGRPHRVEVQDARSEVLASLAGGPHASGEATIRAPMPGLVADVMVAIGDEVHRGQTIVVLEAMKMENDLTTPRAGRVRAIRVNKGQSVSQNEVLATIGDSEDIPALPESEEINGE
ncbi:MAG: biotin/lipoyl-containing protein [Ktedonobacterales bacterium]